MAHRANSGGMPVRGERPLPRSVDFAAGIRSRLRASERGAAAVEPLAHLDYQRELEIKNAALQQFIEQHDLPLSPATITPSPIPRHYRTTTRRRAAFGRQGLKLGFGDSHPSTSPLPPSRLEPAAHTDIYAAILQRLAEPANQPVARRLNYLVIRGSYAAFTVIFNVTHLDAAVVRCLKRLADGLRTGIHDVTSVFAFHDPSRSDYYVEQDAPPVPVRLKRFYGQHCIALEFEHVRYQVPPTGFSQVNGSMVPLLLRAARELLSPSQTDRLLDLYCGYGLFSRFLSPLCGQVVGLDANRDVIEAARRASRADRATTYVARGITPAALQRALPRPDRDELVIMDPPRHGAPADVIATVSDRRPRRVLQVSCAVDALPANLGVWAAHGYRPTDCVALDMFPGTPNLEVLALLAR